MEKPWVRNLVWLFVAFAIAGAIKVIYREIAYKRKIPIESSNPEWQSLGRNTMSFEGKSYDGIFYFDRKSLEKKEGKINIWLKFVTDTPVAQHQGKETYRWNEGILRWIVDCEKKEIKMDYHALYWGGKKQLSGKLDDFSLPIMKGTLSYTIYESLCF